MNLRKIFAVQRKAEKEAQKAVDKIYKKYSAEMNSLIAAEIPKGCEILMYNGLCNIIDKDGNRKETGYGFGKFPSDSPQLDKLSSLQYADEIQGYFNLQQSIKGKKTNS